MILLLSLVGCFFSLPEKAPCTEPHLWYAPDGSGDTYFGCAPPEGWKETPPDEAAFTASTLTTPGTTTGPNPEPDPTSDIDTGHPTVTFPTRDTSPPEPRDTAVVDPPDTGPIDPPDTGLPPQDTSRDTAPPPVDTNDTGAEPPVNDTSDTGLPAAVDQVPRDTAAPPAQDTAAPPVDDDDTGTP